jgi:xanthine dehydrogenase accessory factor
VRSAAKGGAMRDLLSRLFAELAEGQAVAVCRLVATRGSTPQKAGAAMLVLPSGAQAGTLGGGCVEAEVKRRALAVLQTGRAEVADFQLNSDYGWDDGLICGGRMEVLIEPVATYAAAAYFAQMRAAVGRGERVIEAIVYDAAKSGLPAPCCFLLNAGGQLLARHGEGAGEAPAAIVEYMQQLGPRPHPASVNGVAYLPQLPRTRLLIVGGGHVGQAVGNLAVELDFDVWVVDDRAEFVTEERFPNAQRRIAGTIGETLKSLEITPATYCLIVTRGHNHDEEALFHLVDRGAAYVGMIGSKRKIRLIFDDLLTEGVSQEALDAVFAPVGLEIGSQTVMEIAVSILAQLIAVRNNAGVSALAH